MDGLRLPIIDGSNETDGLALPINVGTKLLLGSSDNVADGDWDTTRLGVVEGTAEGAPLLATEGGMLNAILGLNDGDADGEAEGRGEGTVVGTPLGDDVGTSLGLADGDELGRAVGFADGCSEMDGTSLG